MYRSNINKRDRSGAIVAVAAVHALLLFMLLHISGRMDLTRPDSVLKMFDVRDVPPPPPTPPIQPPPQPKPKPKQDEGAASPQNVRSNATDVKAPRPPISLPVPVPMETSTTPSTGMQATQGAANPGPGTGAGGNGTGTGSGGAGNGGGSGGYVTPPRLLTPVFRGHDFPPQLLDSWPRGAQLFLRIRVGPNGSVSQCIVDRGTGIPAIDSTVCAMVQQRFRYSPALNGSGQAVAGWSGYRQVPPR